MLTAIILLISLNVFSILYIIELKTIKKELEEEINEIYKKITEKD